MRKDTQVLLFPGLLLIGAFFFLFAGTLEGMVHQWSTDDNYSHGFIIPFFSAYLVWSSWNRLRSVPIWGSWTGLGVILVGLLGYLAGLAAEIEFVSRVAMLLVLGGILLFCFGRDFFRQTWFPYLFLFFMVPLPYVLYDNIAFPLKLFISKWSVAVVQIMGIPVTRDGNIIHLVNTSLQVADACSGIRSIVSLFALGVALAWFTQRGWVKKVLLISLVIPIAVLANGFRVIGTAALASRFGPEVAQGFYHEFAGLAIFGAAFSMLLLAAILLRKIGAGKND